MEAKRSLRPRGRTGYLSDYLTALKDSLCNSDPLRGGSRVEGLAGARDQACRCDSAATGVSQNQTRPPQECRKQSCVVPENLEPEWAGDAALSQSGSEQVTPAGEPFVCLLLLLLFFLV